MEPKDTPIMDLPACDKFGDFLAKNPDVKTMYDDSLVELYANLKSVLIEALERGDHRTLDWGAVVGSVGLVAALSMLIRD